MSKLYDVTIWDGSRLAATAENIVAEDSQGAARNGVRAIASRNRCCMAPAVVRLYKYLFGDADRGTLDGVRVFAAEKTRGEQVI